MSRRFCETWDMQGRTHQSGRDFPCDPLCPVVNALEQRLIPPKNGMRLRASHPKPHRNVISCSALNDDFSPTALALRKAASATFAETGDLSAISRSRSAHPAVAGGPYLVRAPKKHWTSGERPQRPGNQPHLRAFLELSPGNSPSRITGCRQLCRNHSAGSGTHVFAAHTLNQFVTCPQ